MFLSCTNGLNKGTDRRFILNQLDFERFLVAMLLKILLLPSLAFLLIRVAKTKALIGCAVTPQLICGFVLDNAD